MCNFWARAEWREGIKVVGYYLDVDTTKDQCRLLKPMPLDCIIGYIMDNAVVDKALNRLSHIRLNFIYGSISSYCSILNSPKRFEQISQANKLAYVLYDLESDHMRSK